MRDTMQAESRQSRGRSTSRSLSDVLPPQRRQQLTSETRQEGANSGVLRTHLQAERASRPQASIADAIQASQTACDLLIRRRFLPSLNVGVVALLLSCPALGSPTQAANLPAVKVRNLRQAFHNGEHNAFTDLCRFRNRYYLTFRSCPDGHGVHPTSSIIVLTSGDTRNWRQVHRFRVPRRDTRDPHFLIFRAELFVYTGTWYCGSESPARYDMNQHLGYAARTSDGERWESPVLLEGTYGHYIWRAAAHGGKAYLCGRRKRHFAATSTRAERDPLVESALLESDDGIVWRKVGLFQTAFGDETAFVFESNDALLAVSRSGGRRNAQVVRARPPYTVFERTDLDRYIGGPLLVKWGEHYVVGGRKIVSGDPVTSFYWLQNDRLVEFAELPSGGDNSYPGFVRTSPGQALISYYSSHERGADGRVMTAIYLAEFAIDG